MGACAAVHSPRYFGIIARHGGRILVDTARNTYAQTAVPPYAVRPRPGAPVATPIDWEELSDSKLRPDRWTVKNVIRRLSAKGDPWEDIDEAPQSLEPLLVLHERDRANGLLDAPWPPVYPKMPDEPPRVQPSRARKDPS